MTYFLLAVLQLMLTQVSLGNVPASDIEILEAELNSERLEYGCAYTDTGLIFADYIAGGGYVIYEYIPDLDDPIVWLHMTTGYLEIRDISNSSNFAMYDGTAYEIFNHDTGEVTESYELPARPSCICGSSDGLIFFINSGDEQGGVTNIYCGTDNNIELINENIYRGTQNILDVAFHNDMYYLLTETSIEITNGDDYRETYIMHDPIIPSDDASLSMFDDEVYLTDNNTVSHVEVRDVTAFITETKTYSGQVLHLFFTDRLIVGYFDLERLRANLMDNTYDHEIGYTALVEWDTGAILNHVSMLATCVQIGQEIYELRPYSILQTD